jgi:hypothetical protein
MAYFGLFGGGDEPEAEEQDAGDDDIDLLVPQQRVQVQVQRSGGARASLQTGTDKAPRTRSRRKPPKRVAADSDDSSDDSDDVGGGAAAINGQCEPIHACVPVLATHVVMRVRRATAISADECEGKDLHHGFLIEPGRIGVSHFLDCTPISVVTGTMAVIHADDTPPFEARRRRCIADRRPLVDIADEQTGVREMRWENEPGEVRVKLRPLESAVCAALVVQSEVVGVTRPISLTSFQHRFFTWHAIYRPGFARQGIAEDIGSVEVAFQLWPPGSKVHDPNAERDEDLDSWLPNKSKVAAEERASCAFCDGVGRKQCQSCNGHGVLVCTACDGTPALPCTQCRGTGVLESRLDAVGPRYRSVASVAGRQCTTCWGASIACNSCFGMGGVVLSACEA